MARGLILAALVFTLYVVGVVIVSPAHRSLLCSGTFQLAFCEVSEFGGSGDESLKSVFEVFKDGFAKGLERGAQVYLWHDGKVLEYWGRAGEVRKIKKKRKKKGKENESKK